MAMVLRLGRQHLLFFTMIVLLATGISYANAIIPNPGHSVTEIDFSQPISQNVEIQGNLKVTGEIQDKTWKLLAKGGDWTEEAVITISSSGASWETDHKYSNQKLNIGMIHWPEDPSSVSEIMFVAKNRGDNFCAGGDYGVIDIDGDNIPPRRIAVCINHRLQGTTDSKAVIYNQNDWIRLKINGNIPSGCPDQYGRTSLPDGTPKGYSGSNFGVYGDGHWPVFCYYPVSGTLDELRVEEVDWSDDYGRWEWEIWYR